MSATLRREPAGVTVDPVTRGHVGHARSKYGDLMVRMREAFDHVLNLWPEQQTAGPWSVRMWNDMIARHRGAMHLVNADITEGFVVSQPVQGDT